MSSRTVGLLMATTTALSWSVLAIGLKFALEYFSSGTIVAVRMILAFTILATLFVWRHPKGLRVLWQPPWLGLIAGAFIAFNYFGYIKGVELTGASNAQIMIQMAPLSFALLSIFLFREIPTRMQAFGIAVATLGFGFFYWDQILISLHHLRRFENGDWWLLGAAATWTVFALAQKYLLRKFQPQQLNLLIFGVSAILLVPTAHVRELRVVTWPLAALIAFLALNTVVAYGALTEAIQRIPAAHVGMIIAVNPLLTLALMTYLTRMKVGWIAGEPIHWRGFLGAMLVVAGVVLTVARPARKLSG